MEFYLNSLEELFSPTKERTFTNRTEILELLNIALINLNDDSKPYQIFSIHGIGGIGKTRLVKKFIKIVFPEPVIYVSFEIEKRSEVINNLYQIRKNITMPCPFFDFALFRYWEMTNPAALNDDFMSIFKKDFFLSMLDSIAEVLNCSSSFLQDNVMIPSIISPSAIIDFMNNIYRKVPQLLYTNLFESISKTSIDQLVHKLPVLLGIEIKKHIIKGTISYPVFVFDSYQESQPYSESEEWLLHLIESVGQGLFIITSREKIKWKTQNAYLIPYHLTSYPKEDARLLLEETVTNRSDLIELIIESTECVPIYIDLALNVYESEKNLVGDELIEKSLFHDRHKLVNHFINHLKPSWQSVVYNLATIRVFNYDIFEYLVKNRVLDCAPYEYHSIIESNLFNYVSESSSNNLCKLHDVFCKDVQVGRAIDECYSIYKIYMKYICYRRDYILQENNGAVLAALLQNLLYLGIVFEERMMLEALPHFFNAIEESVVEQLLDIFFTLASNKVRFEALSFDNIKTETMRKVCQFIYAKTYEKVNTLNTIKILETIGDTTCFGKHQLSYEAVLFYTKSLTGHYDELKNWTNKIEQKLDVQTKNEWFYNRIKIYQADCDMLQGRFNSALNALALLQNNYMSSEDYYSIHRTIGHIQRFNFLLNNSYLTYNTLIKHYKQNTVFKEYLSTNLIETLCYFPDSNFIRKTEKLLHSMRAVYNIKNKGKVLYALAIAKTVKKNYSEAQLNINECLSLNKKDGYQSGELFAYMAQAYLDYAITGSVTEKTINNIEHLFSKNGVYLYFRLPLAIMKEDLATIYKLSTEYEWIDFHYTETEYRRFLKQLQNT